MSVLRVDPERALALCQAADGSRRSVETALLDSVEAGDSVLVHAGVALVTVGRGP